MQFTDHRILNISWNSQGKSQDISLIFSEMPEALKTRDIIDECRKDKGHKQVLEFFEQLEKKYI